MDRLGGPLDGQRSPKGGPRGSQMALPRPLEQEISNLANSLISIDFIVFLLIFEVSRGPFGGPKRYQIMSRGPSCSYKASRRPLEASWSRLEGLWVALGAVLEARHRSAGGQQEVRERSGRGQGSIFGWPWPPGAPRARGLLINNNETHPAMRGLTRPGPKARRIQSLRAFRQAWDL